MDQIIQIQNGPDDPNLKWTGLSKFKMDQVIQIQNGPDNPNSKWTRWSKFKMDLVIQIQILDVAVGIFICVNTLEKGMNSSLLPPPICK